MTFSDYEYLVDDDNQRVCAFVDLTAMLGNMEHMHANIDQSTQMIAVIKTDGYGHGAVQLARQLEERI